MAISFSPQSSAPPTRDAVEAEELAYMLLEEARLRIESLADRYRGSVRFRRAHQYLGLAGYHCSAELTPAQRLWQLALAHERATAAADDSLDTAVNVAVRAIAAVEDALVATGLAGHMQQTLVDAITACECFDALYQATA
jgi:hypothetical protein